MDRTGQYPKFQDQTYGMNEIAGSNLYHPLPKEFRPAPHPSLTLHGFFSDDVPQCPALGNLSTGSIEGQTFVPSLDHEYGGKLNYGTLVPSRVSNQELSRQINPSEFNETSVQHLWDASTHIDHDNWARPSQCWLPDPLHIEVWWILNLSSSREKVHMLIRRDSIFQVKC